MWRCPTTVAAVAAAVTAALSLQGCDVLDSVEAAISAGAAGDISGGIPLSASEWADGFRLAIMVSPVGQDGTTLPAQRLLLDTGSTTLAFCDQGLAQGLGKLRTTYASCNRYNPGGTPTGYWGWFYRGTVQLQGSRQAVSLDRSFYSVMEEEASMLCKSGFSGIFGIAFGQLGAGFPIDGPLDLFGPGAADECPRESNAVAVPPPLLQFLQQGAGPQHIGIHWSGQSGESEGALYLGEAATTNPHYAQGSLVGSAALGEVGWYDISIGQISLPVAQHTWTGIQCSPTSGTASNCILDTGTPSLVVPQAVFDGVQDLYESSFGAGSIQFSLAGAQGGPAVTLEFDIASLMQQGQITTGEQTGIIIGLPVWAWYYTVFDIQAHAVMFVAGAASDAGSSPLPGLPFGLVAQNGSSSPPVPAAGLAVGNSSSAFWAQDPAAGNSSAQPTGHGRRLAGTIFA
mmetsp:Transcript_61949/g.191825  ORF Transcript_61949/g.191825 Transcript_61949/m.191825 type:complete len:457 (-) Transcript_61949:118-1488(-)